jgi:hypothetical protein
MSFANIADCIIVMEDIPLIVLEYRIDKTPTIVKIRDTINPAINPLITTLFM